MPNLVFKTLPYSETVISYCKLSSHFQRSTIFIASAFRTNSAF